MRTAYMPEIISGYLEDYATQGHAQATLEARETHMRRLERACAEVARERGKRSPLRPDELDNQVIRTYFGQASGKPGNMNNHLAAIRGFLTWAEINEFIGQGSGARLLSGRKHRKVTRQPKYYVPAGQFGDLLRISAARHPSNRAAMALALYTLGRSSEITGLTVGNLDLDAGVMQMWREKRDRWTEVGICPELRDELGAWLDWYAFHLGALNPEWHVIPRLIPKRTRTAQNGQISGTSGYDMEPDQRPAHMERLVKRALDVTGAKTADGKSVRHLGEGMHTIRRSGARAMLDNLSLNCGFDRALLQVSVMLDHEDPKMTLRYIGMDQEREQLNDWLRSNSPYGTGPKVPLYGPESNGDGLTARPRQLTTATAQGF